MFKNIIFSLAIFATISYAYNDVYVNLNSNDLEFGAELDLSLRDEMQDLESRYIVGLNYLKPDQKDSLLDLKIVGQGQMNIGYNSLFVGVGAKLAYLNKDFYALPIGLVVGTEFDQLVINKITLTGQIFYSPKPLTFSNGDHYQELRAEVSYSLIPLAQIYAGYRKIDIEYDQNYVTASTKVTFTDDLYFGVKFIF